jgi:hypothetical protein
MKENQSRMMLMVSTVVWPVTPSDKNGSSKLRDLREYQWLFWTQV